MAPKGTKRILYTGTPMAVPNWKLFNLIEKAGGVVVGAGAGNEERVDALVAAGVDVLLIDSSHGHSEGVLQRIRETRAKYPDLQIIGGNVATAAGARALAEAGCSAVKVGIGPGRNGCSRHCSIRIR